MKLLLAIVQDPDAGRLQHALTEAGFGVTRLSSTGGFLRRGNTTLLIGIDDEKLDEVTAIVSRVCRRRQELLVPGASVVDPEGVFSTVMETVATLFVLGVESFMKL